DKTIYHKNLNGSTWTPGRTAAWEQLGSKTFVTQPIPVTWGSSETILATGTDGHVWLKSYNGMTWTPSMTGWTDLGGPVYGRVAAVALGANQLEIVAQ